MKKLIVLSALLMWCMAAFALTHKVARGETLESIAAKYNITETQLIKANPGAAALFYVGLVLNIPENTAAPATQTQQQAAVPSQQPSVPQQTPNLYGQNNLEVADDEPGASYTMMLEYGFLGNRNFAYAFTVGANYYFMHKDAGLFAGARIGYNSASFRSHTRIGVGSYLDMTYDTHFVTLPINIGYSLANNNRNFGITPYAGFDFNFCVAGNAKVKQTGQGSGKEEKLKISKKIGIDARLGVQLRFYHLNIGCSYVIPLDKNQKIYFGEDSYLAVNIGYGF